MTYQQVTRWLFEQLPNYHQQGGVAYKPGLDVISNVLDQLGNPHKKIKTIHIAGTNGKGSVSHMLAAVFSSNGYKTGLFTSPHIHDFRERIKIDGELISEEFVCQFVVDHENIWEEIKPTFFEITTAMAFEAFYRHNCDIAIIETGLGGRLDASNVVHPELSIITNIGLEHTNYLGNTLQAIANEKAGIIKHGIPVVIGEKQSETEDVFRSVARSNNSSIFFSDSDHQLKTDLRGSYQQKNLNTVAKSIEVLVNSGWKLQDGKNRRGLLHVAEITGFQGRMEVLKKNPLVIRDAAHNVEGVTQLMKDVSGLTSGSLHLIYGGSNDKDLNNILSVFPPTAHVYLTTFPSVRSFTLDELRSAALNANFDFIVEDHPEKALKLALARSDQKDAILIFGSFYLLEHIKKTSLN